jgi:hypothetical protein
MQPNSAWLRPREGLRQMTEALAEIRAVSAAKDETSQEIEED